MKQCIREYIQKGQVRLQVGSSEATNKLGGRRTDSVVFEDCVWE